MPQPLLSMPMIRKLGGWVFANWPIKLTALVLAIVLWAVVTAEETVTQLVPVSLVVQPPEGRTVVEDLPAVQARYRGTLRELLKLYENPPVIHKDIPATTGTSTGIQLSPDDLQGVDDADVAALEVLPGSILVVLDDIHRKTVPVISRVELRPQSGHEVFGSVRISPATVTIQGPAVLVTPFESANTIPFQRNGLTEPVDYTILIDTTGFGLVTVEPPQVRVTANIGAVSTQVLMGVAVVVEGPGGPWESLTSAVSVTVRGPESRVARFTRDSLRVVARPIGTNETERELVVALEVIVPDGISGTATPDSVVVRRAGSG
jgi:hypothetical protein